MTGIPRVTRRGKASRLGGHRGAELRHIGTAERDEAGRPELLREVGRDWPGQLTQRSDAECRGLTRDRQPRSLYRIGTPRNGPSGRSPSASSRAASNRVRITASSCGLTASIRAMAASASSLGLTSPRRTRSACAVASSHVVSVMPPTLRAWAPHGAMLLLESGVPSGDEPAMLGPEQAVIFTPDRQVTG
jgi:hypothetical protein